MNVSPPGSLGNALRILRVSRRITLESTAKVTGIWPATILKYEKGAQRLPYLVMAKLVRGMGYPMEAVQLAQSFDLDLDSVFVEPPEVLE